MTEKIYPLIIWFYYQNKLRLFSKIRKLDLGKNETKSTCEAFEIADAIRMLRFEIPIEISLLTQSSSTPSAIEVNRVAGVNIHTLTEESAVFILSKNGQFLAMSQENIRIHFVQEFSDFREKHRYAISEKRSVVAEKVKRCDDVYKALDF